MLRWPLQNICGCKPDFVGETNVSFLVLAANLVPRVNGLLCQRVVARLDSGGME